MADNQEFSKFTLTSKKDPISGAYSIASYDKDVRAFLNAVKSALPKDAFFSVGEKELSKQGKLKIDIYTHKEDAGLVRKALAERAEELYFKGSTDEKYNIVKRRTVTREEQKSLVKEETERTNKESEKTREKNHRGIVANFLKVLGSLTVLTDIARRILSTVMTNATESVRTAVTAHNMGMAYKTVKEYEQIETKSGLELGTISKAIADLQARFGNELSLDTEGLEYLGILLGSELGDLLISQLRGGANEDALALILDKANEIVAEGKSPTGQYVGEPEARVKMYNYLLRMFPELASIFAKQQDQMKNINSIYYDTFSDFAGWKDVMLKGVPEYSTLQQGLVQTLGEYKDATDALVKRLKDNITITLAPALIKILDRIANLRIGLSATENRAMDLANLKQNKQYASELERRLTMLPSSTRGMTPEQQLQYEATKKVYQRYLNQIKEEEEGFRKGQHVALVQTVEQMLPYEIGEEVLDMMLSDEGALLLTLPKLKSVVQANYPKYKIDRELNAEAQKVHKARIKELDKSISESEKEITDKDVRDKIESDLRNIEREIENQEPYKGMIQTDSRLRNAVAVAQARYLGVPITTANNGRLVYQKVFSDALLETTKQQMKEEKEQARVEAKKERDKLASKESLTLQEEMKVYSDLAEASKLTLQDMEIEFEEQSAKGETNPYYTGSLVDLRKIDEESKRLIESGARATVSSNVTNEIGGTTSNIVLTLKDEKGAVLGEQLLYSGREQTLYEGELGTVINTNKGLQFVNAMQQSASEAK